MTTTCTIARRELASFLLSPVAYIVMVVFYLAFGLIFYLIVAGSNFATMEWTFDFTSLILVLAVPALTMRQIAEERRLGTIEGILTAPVTHTSFVVGKFLGAFGFFLILLVPSAIHAWTLFHFSPAGPDPWKLASGYLGLVLLGAFMISFGLFCSSLTRSQVVAALVGVVPLFLLWLLGTYVASMSPPATLQNSTWEAFLKALYAGGKFITFKEHFTPFCKGIIDLRDLVFFVSFVVFFLFLAVGAVANRKWR